MSSFLHPRFKLHVHIVEIILIHAVLILAIVRIITGTGRMSMADRMAMGMSAKSLIIIFYQLMTEHIRRFRRWASPKANLILNSMEIVFWAAIVFLAARANIQQTCSGTPCTLSWVIVVLGVLLSALSGFAAVLSYIQFRASRNNRTIIDSESRSIETHELRHAGRK